QQVAHRAVQHADRAGGHRGAVLAAGDPAAAWLDADDADPAVGDERVEQPDGVAAAAHAGDDDVRQPAEYAPGLSPRLFSDHGVEVAHHHGIGMRAERRAEQIVRGADVGDPVAQRLVHRVLQRLAPRLHRDDLGPEQPHPEDVERLALDVLRAHVHRALEPEQRGGGGRGHAVLAGAGLGDHTRLLHAHGEQRLAEHVVDLVGAGVAEVLALEPDARAAAVLAEPRREVERRRTAGVIREQPGQPSLERAVAPRGDVRLLQLDERRHQRLRHEAPAEAPEVAGGVGQRLHRAPFASAMKRCTLSGSFLPGLASTPELTSTAYGWTTLIAPATLSGVRPPDRMIGMRASGGCRAPVIRIIRHSTGSRACPSLQRASLSKRMAAAVLCHRNAPSRSRMRYSGRPSIVDAGGSLIVLITGTPASCQSSGLSSPCSWIARRRQASITAFTWPTGWSQKMPTVVVKGGSRRTIDATCSGVTNRGVFSTKMKPSASAPARTARRASSRLVMPQIFTRVTPASARESSRRRRSP